MTAFVNGKQIIGTAFSSIVQAAVAVTLHLFLFKIYIRDSQMC